MKLFSHISILVFTFSCSLKQSNQERIKENNKSSFSVVQKIDTILSVSHVDEKINKEWQELASLNSFIFRFKETSVNEAFSNVDELTSLVKSLKDSVNPKLFNNASFRARVNVFYNETLRLKDMATIDDISKKEATGQIKRVLNSYSAVNSKINSILKEEALEQQIDSAIENTVLNSLNIQSFENKEKRNKNKR